ncbi:thioredoxin [Gallibacterium anatis]|uniref:thioredoxin n=1 Tax=Gallibacterium anatis TaxID=750 RepID=UPI00254AE2BC|nr:thioredoxin [Gallibacterium anatis]MDK9560065.1 thioredoxin [Gallibacterium anatis]
MNKLLTISDIQQEIQRHTLNLLLIKAPNCGVCTVVENQLKTLLNENQEIYAIQANIGDTPRIGKLFSRPHCAGGDSFFREQRGRTFRSFYPLPTAKNGIGKVDRLCC